jgi:hypothetical protein
MKKVIFTLSILLFMLGISGCGENKTDYEPILGSWEAEMQISVLGISPPAVEGQTADATYRLEFYEDGTGKSAIISKEYADHISDIETNFTYSLDGEKLELTHENGSIQSFSVSFSDEKLILDGRAHIELVRIK